MSITIHLKIKKAHPHNAFRIGSLVISSYDFKPYEIEEDKFEAFEKEFLTEGVQAWISCKEFDEQNVKAEEIEEEVPEEDVKINDTLGDYEKEQEELEAKKAAEEIALNNGGFIDETKTVEEKPVKEKKNK